MKKLINTLNFALLLAFGAITVISCDPCSGVICTDGMCSNGVCVCDDGHIRVNDACVGFNKYYEGQDLSIVETMIDTSLHPTGKFTSNETYTIVAEENNPYLFTLKNFDGKSGNHVTFTINTKNKNLIVGQSVVSASGLSYTISGARTSTKFQLKLEAAPKTWTLSFNK